MNGVTNFCLLPLALGLRRRWMDLMVEVHRSVVTEAFIVQVEWPDEQRTQKKLSGWGVA